MSLTALARPADIIWKFLESREIDPDPLFRELHIDPKFIQDPNARYRISAMDDLWTSAARLTGDPCMGLKAVSYWHPSHMHSLGYAWLASSTLRMAFQRLSRYIRILSDVPNVEMEENAEEFSVVLTYRGGSARLPWRTDFGLAVMTAMCRINYGDKLDPVSVSFMHSEPLCAGEYYAYFRCPLQFDAPANRLTLNKGIMDEPLATDNPQLAQLNDQIMIQYLAQLDKENIIERVKAVIIDQLPSGKVTDQAVAEALYMNVRTLQRKLQDESTTFKALLDGVRQELAHQYIRDSRLNVNEISFLLGFSDISSFSRAFKRWTGEPPSSYRDIR